MFQKFLIESKENGEDAGDADRRIQIPGKQIGTECSADSREARGADEGDQPEYPEHSVKGVGGAGQNNQEPDERNNRGK